MSASFELRPLLVARIWAAGFGTFWCGAVIVGGINALRHGTSGVLVAAVMLIIGVALAYRLVTLGVFGRGDELVVRNNFRTRRLTRSEIEDFRVGSASGGLPVNKAISVLLMDGSLLNLDVTTCLTVLPRGRRRLDQQLLTLRAWRRL